MIRVPIANEQTALPIDEARLRQAVRMILEEASIGDAEVSLAVVDDPTIHALNRRYLDHDHATDVLSFVLERSEAFLEGQIIVSADTARSEAARFGWSPAEELLLYVIHGALHLVGYDDHAHDDREAMRAKERTCLAHFGLEPHWNEASEADTTAFGGEASK